MWNVSPDRAFKKIWNSRHFSENRRYQLGKRWRFESSRRYWGMPISCKKIKLSDVLLFTVGVVRLCWQWHVTFCYSVDSDMSLFCILLTVMCQCCCILLTVTCHFFVFCWQWRVGGPDGEVPVHLPVPPPWPADPDLRWGQTQWLPPVAGTSKSSQSALILKTRSLPKAGLC